MSFGNVLLNLSYRDCLAANSVIQSFIRDFGSKSTSQERKQSSGPVMLLEKADVGLSLYKCMYL